ncbi:24294_t:CDS:1, partial [Gigaspora rosea]
MFDKTDIYETSHEAKIVEYEIEIMGELEKAKMDEVENSSDGLLDWLTIIDDGYLE